MRKLFRCFCLMVLAAAAVYGALYGYEYWQQNRTRVLIEVPLANQHPDYPTGCESIALYMLLKYYETEVTPAQIVDSLPKGSLPYEKNGKLYGANPEREFVGDPRDPHSYGVYNQPIRDTANLFRSGAVTKNGATIDEIKALLDSGVPVMLWYTTQDSVGVRPGSQWLDEQTGETITWMKYEHAVVACGYKKNDLIINDPNTGTRREIRFGNILMSFDRLGGRIVYYPPA